MAALESRRQLATAQAALAGAAARAVANTTWASVAAEDGLELNPHPP